MIELTQNKPNTNSTDDLSIVSPISTNILQLRHIKGNSVFMTDPEGSIAEIKTTDDGAKMVFTKDEQGKTLAIEERKNGTRLYHISSDSTGLPSTHEIRLDKTEIVYFYNAVGDLKHFVELKPTGDRISTVLADSGAIYSIEQKQIGGIIFHGWLSQKEESKEGMVWLHPDGEISSHGDEIVVKDLMSKFSRFLDGVVV